MGARTPLSVLIKDFTEGSGMCFFTNFNSSVGFRAKLEQVSKSYGSYRKIRPDGNCFYRAYLFGIFEVALSKGPDAVAKLGSKFKELAEECKSTYDSFAIDEFQELFEEQIQTLVDKSDMSLIFSDSSIDGYLIALMRCICGAALKRWSDEYTPFLPSEYATIESFCRAEVDPMYRDCDQLQIVALTRILHVPIDIIYLDQSEQELAIHSFGDEASGQRIPLLYKPGHYDLLYPL